jgi:hypothetical protein
LHLGLVAVLQAQDEVVRVDRLGGADDVLAGGVGPAEGDVLGDGAREQEPLLRDDPELAAQRGLGDVA